LLHGSLLLSLGQDFACEYGGLSHDFECGRFALVDWVAVDELFDLPPSAADSCPVRAGLFGAQFS